MKVYRRVSTVDKKCNNRLLFWLYLKTFFLYRKLDQVLRIFVTYTFILQQIVALHAFSNDI